MVANQLYELCEAVGPEPTRYYFFPYILQVLHTFLSWFYLMNLMRYNLWAEFTSLDNNVLIPKYVRASSIDFLLHMAPAQLWSPINISIFLEILTCSNYCLWRAELVPAYVRLLRDNEAEVRIAAAGKVTKFCRILSPDLAIQHILPCVKVGIFGKENSDGCLILYLYPNALFCFGCVI